MGEAEVVPHTITLFGVQITVAISANDQEPVDNGLPGRVVGEQGPFSNQERPNIDQTSDQKGVDQRTSCDDDRVDTILDDDHHKKKEKMSFFVSRSYSDHCREKEKVSSKKRASSVTENAGRAKRMVSLGLHGDGCSRNSVFQRGPVLNPMPLRGFHEELGFQPQFSTQKGRPFDQESDQNSSPPPLSKIDKKQKNVVVTAEDDQEKKNMSEPPSKRINTKRVEVDGQNNIPSPDDISGLQQIIGTMPEFLYRKRLKESDVNPSQNRLLITNSEKLIEYLTGEEKMAVTESKDGLKFFAIDPRGNEYHLHLKSWASVNRYVINSKGWRELITNNNVKQGDSIVLWGFRLRGEFRLAFDFRKPEGSAQVEEAQSNDDDSVN